MRQRLDVPQRPLRRGVAESRQPGHGLLGGEPQRLRGHACHGLQQRPVEQLLVQPPDLVGVLAELREQHLPLRQPPISVQPDRAREPAQRRGVVIGREEVRTQQPLQLQPVLQRAQEPVRTPEVRRVVAPDVPAGAQRGQRGRRRLNAQVLVRTSVHELQQLHRELDVPQTTAAELELAVGEPGGHVVLDAAAHRLHVLDEVLTLGRRPHVRPHDVEVRLTQLGVTRDRPGLQQRLELPGPRPLLVVGGVSVQRADQRTRLALRPQRRVDLEARLAGDLHHRAGQPRRHAQIALADEHDVDVTHVVQLVRAALAHRDHREPAPVRAVDPVRGELQRRPQRRHGEIRELCGHGVVRHEGQRRLDDVRQVVGCHEQQLRAVLGAQHVAIGKLQRHVDPVGQRTPPVRVRDEEVRQRGRRAEHGEQTPAHDLVLVQRDRQGIPVGGCLEPLQPAQREIGIRAPGQREQHRLGALGGTAVSP